MLGLFRRRAAYRFKPTLEVCLNTSSRRFCRGARSATKNASASGRAAYRFVCSPGESVDGASLAVFRMLFGLLMFGSTVRFMALGWVDRCYGEPTFFFKYWGFAWVRSFDVSVMYALFGVVALAALGMAIGLFYRWCAVVFTLVFTYVELIDVTNYLNHYYLVSLLGVLCCLLPLDQVGSLDGWRRRRRGIETGATVPKRALSLLRFQVGVVYLFAGLAKLEPDWLLHGQPLGIWLASRSEAPMMGAVGNLPYAALVFSWAGFVHDLLAPFLLSHRVTRRWFFPVLVLFHGGTFLLFNIGIFPLLMPICALLFFEPGFPRRLLKPMGCGVLPSPSAPLETKKRNGPHQWFVGAWMLLQVLVPLRTHLYGGNVLWHEQGMRWSWRVMLREKNGSITYRVRSSAWQGERLVSPRRYLTSHQEREMSGQPDMVLQLGKHVGEQAKKRGLQDVQVFVDALVSLNGRPGAPMIDPSVDLMTVRDGVGLAGWILPAPKGPPLRWRAP